MEPAAGTPPGPGSGATDAGAPPPSAPPGLRPLALWPWVLGLLAGLAVTVLALSGNPGAEDLADLGEMAFYGLAAVLSLRASRKLEGPLRRGWQLLGAGCLLVFLAYLSLIALAAAGAELPEGDDYLPFLVVINGLMFVGLVLLCPPDMVRGSRLRIALDGLIAGGSILFLILVSVEHPLQASSGAAEVLLSDLLYPAIDAASLTVALLVLAHSRRATPPWYAALAAAAAVSFVADVWLVTGLGAEGALSGVPLVYLGAVGTAALLARPWEAHKSLREPLGTQAAIYVPFGLALAGACYDFVENDGLHASLFFLLVGLVGLVVARTVMLLAENRNLYADFEATDSFKTQLLRFISHEIANPLSPLKVQVELLRTGVARDLDRAWNAIERSIGRLESLSRDVRLMALAETRRIVQSTQLTDLVPRIASAVQAHQAVANQRGVTLRAELPNYPLAVPLDGERMDQVVDNLLSNALKFTPAGGTISVRLWRAPGGLAVFEVQDSGAGMSPEQQARLFSAFGRPQGSTTPGLGLGLYLCKAIVDGHGGRITASSDGAGKGSRFRVELQPGRTSGPLRKKAVPPPTGPTRKDPATAERPSDLPL